MLNILRSLRKRIVAKNFIGCVFNDYYTIEDLYKQIPMTLNKYINLYSLTIRYLTPDKKLGKVIKFYFHSCDVIERVLTLYTFPQKEDISYYSKEDVRDYIKKDNILKNRYIIDGTPINFEIEIIRKIYLYSIDGGTSNINSLGSVPYHYPEKTIRLDDRRSINILNLYETYSNSIISVNHSCMNDYIYV
jgi:hypothetical protein